MKGVCSHSTYLVVCSPPEQDLGLNRSQSPCLQTHTHTHTVELHSNTGMYVYHIWTHIHTHTHTHGHAHTPHTHTHTHTHRLTRAGRLPEGDGEVFSVKVDVEAHHGDGPNDCPASPFLHPKVVEGAVPVAGSALLLHC